MIHNFMAFSKEFLAYIYVAATLPIFSSWIVSIAEATASTIDDDDDELCELLNVLTFEYLLHESRSSLYSMSVPFPSFS